MDVIFKLLALDLLTDGSVVQLLGAAVVQSLQSLLPSSEVNRVQTSDRDSWLDEEVDGLSLVDVDLTGLLLGATLATKPEEIYRALIEATAYGTRVIVEAFEKNGVPIHELVACGGLPEKSPLLMLIYADVTGRPFQVSASTQTPALGSAMFGAVAAGKAAGGYESIFDAAKAMAHLKKQAYCPLPENQAVYESLFGEYVRLHDFFGRGGNDVMKRLKKLRSQQRVAAVSSI